MIWEKKFGHKYLHCDLQELGFFPDLSLNMRAVKIPYYRQVIRWKFMHGPIRDEQGGPLVEESLLLGIAVVTVSIVIAVILQATGWAQDVVAGLFQILEDSWSSLTSLFP